MHETAALESSSLTYLGSNFLGISDINPNIILIDKSET